MNEKNHEIYVSATNEPIFQMTDALRRERPSALQHWELDDVGTVRSIEFNMTAKDALAFIGNYIKTGTAKGWKFLT